MTRRLAAIAMLTLLLVVSCSGDDGVDLSEVRACSLINLAEGATLGKIDRFNDLGSEDGVTCEFTNDKKFPLVRIDLWIDEPPSEGYQRLLDAMTPRKRWTEDLGELTAQVYLWGPKNINHCDVVVDTSDSQGFKVSRTNDDKPVDVCASALEAARIVLRNLAARTPQD